MCNEFARQKQLADAIAEFDKRALPLFGWRDGLVPNLDAQPSIRIRDTAVVVRLRDGRLEGDAVTWAWPGPRGAPVFNFRSEGRDFSLSDRVLVLADGFFEYTAPQAKGVKLKDRHRFTLAGADWFWIAGIVKEGCFTLLTTEPGPDVKPYHDRQIVTFAPQAGMDWLTLARPEGELLRPGPAGTLVAQTLRKDGVDLAA
ncbi:SOS response-associated peptidase family protein [Phenylobacterium sp. LH3H17]|uniref:SOS response-associated peptidase family protein n=1 Tax=Phenylobacterium sp. LH3H17 TaxID=2903901 RepID=UPI0020C9D1DE|nr:SOS response-associated peptidase family protein [Phenylobacterium sp. LH3H17]UTP39602.1 SOS response-associated peptidase family protein [Phenylobacterium sp. LH3H17]